MKTLKMILASVYLILIMLLLLINCRGCDYLKDKQVRTLYPADAVDADSTVQTDLIKQAENTGNKGNLKITLLWNFKADLDLHVMQPNGQEIFFSEKEDKSTGGFLDVDNQNGGEGAAENIFWENPPSGQYTVSVVYYDTKGDIPETGICDIVVFIGEEAPRTYQVAMRSVKQRKEVTLFSIQ